jgi:hypothetical protein
LLLLDFALPARFLTLLSRLQALATALKIRRLDGPANSTSPRNQRFLALLPSLQAFSAPCKIRRVQAQTMFALPL